MYQTFRKELHTSLANGLKLPRWGGGTMYTENTLLSILTRLILGTCKFAPDCIGTLPIGSKCTVASVLEVTVYPADASPNEDHRQ
jgi:hypothetical protein